MSKKPIKVGDRKKAWNKKGRKKTSYEVDKGKKQKTFLIICEGENTEPEYFKSFPVKTADVSSYGSGRSRMALVKYVIETVKGDKDKDREIWVVFDMDIDKHTQNPSKHKQDYENAIYLAQKHNFRIAFSNDAFELWFLLHYIYFDNEWTRHEYYDKLGELWNCNYENVSKKKAFCKEIYKILKDDDRASQEKAIERAKRLLSSQIDKRLSERNPCTSVFSLVEELNNHI